jgi:drug/metabolite transporter (DMT)-like permease
MKTFVVLGIAALCAAVGETFLSYGMRQRGMVSVETAGKMFDHLLVVVKQYHVTIGVVFMGGFFYLYLASLSWADLSYAKPITSLSFFFAALFARLFLGEEVSWPRWLGTVLILIGVAFVSLDPRQFTPSRSTANPTALEE